MLTAIARSMEAHNGGRDGDRTSNRATADGMRGLRHQVHEVRSFRDMLAAYSADRPASSAPTRR